MTGKTQYLRVHAGETMMRRCGKVWQSLLLSYCSTSGSRPKCFCDVSISGDLFVFGLCVESPRQQTRHSSGWLAFDKWFESFTSHS